MYIFIKGTFEILLDIQIVITFNSDIKKNIVA